MRMHARLPEGRFCNVFLDGEKLLDCLIADDDEGWAACMFRDAAGKIVHIEGEVVTEIKRGKIHFEFDPDTAKKIAAVEAQREIRREQRAQAARV